MEHITVTELPEGILRLTPAEGWRLYNTITRRFYSVAEVKDARPYVAVEDKESKVAPDL